MHIRKAIHIVNKIDTKHLNDLLNNYQGNVKKISIICAMQHEPDLYILDEPTSGLDPLMQKVFYYLVLERNKQGATVFLSSHILSEIQRYCHNVAIIREGKLIAVDYITLHYIILIILASVFVFLHF